MFEILRAPYRIFSITKTEKNIYFGATNKYGKLPFPLYLPTPSQKNFKNKKKHHTSPLCDIK